VKGRNLLCDCHVDELIQNYTFAAVKLAIAERQMINQKWL
jgi:hypothetical protein